MGLGYALLFVMSEKSQNCKYLNNHWHQRKNQHWCGILHNLYFLMYIWLYLITFKFYSIYLSTDLHWQVAIYWVQYSLWFSREASSVNKRGITLFSNDCRWLNRLKNKSSLLFKLLDLNFTKLFCRKLQICCTSKCLTLFSCLICSGRDH